MVSLLRRSEQQAAILQLPLLRDTVETLWLLEDSVCVKLCTQAVTSRI